MTSATTSLALSGVVADAGVVLALQERKDAHGDYPSSVRARVDGGREHVDLFEGVVHRERGAGGRRNAQPIHDRLRAVMTGADRHAFTVDDRADIVRMDTVDDERDDGDLVARGADEAHAVDGAERGGGLVEQCRLVGLDGLEADALQVLDGAPKADRAGDVRRTCLELVRQVVPGAPLEGHGANHVAAAEKRRHRVEEGFLPVENADSGRPVDLVAR